VPEASDGLGLGLEPPLKGTVLGQSWMEHLQGDPALQANVLRYVNVGRSAAANRA
jgi:hypothetical protein